MLILSNVRTTSGLPNHALRIYYQASTGKMMHSLTTQAPRASILSDHYSTSLKAAVIQKSLAELVEISITLDESKTSVSSLQLNHKWLIYKYQNITIIYSDSKNEGLHIEKDDEFPLRELHCDGIDPPYLAERNCELILNDRGVSFSDLKQMPKATPEKIDLIVHKRSRINALINNSGKEPKAYFESLLSLNEQEMRNRLSGKENTLISPSL